MAALVGRTTAYDLTIYLFRNDLRLHDNPALSAAVSACEKSSSLFLPMYCFDPRFIGGPNSDATTSRLSHLPKTSAARAKFTIESVENLKFNLVKKNSNLLVYQAKPEDAISSFVNSLSENPPTKVNVFTQREVASEEIDMISKINTLKCVKKVTNVWGSTVR